MIDQEKQEVIEEVATSDDDLFFTNEPDEDDDSIELEPEKEEFADADDDTDTDEEDQEAQEDDADKLDKMSPEEIKKAYRNLEAVVGRQGQELGELRKKVSPEPETKREYPPDKVYTEDDIPSLPDDVLDSMIKVYEDYLSIPNQSLDDAENFGIKTIQYNKLMLEKSQRMVQKKQTTQSIAAMNKSVAESYTAKMALSPADLAKAQDYALNKLSDDGKLTEHDLDVAVHKLFPDKWSNKTIEKERERIAKAKTPTPRIPANASINPNKTVSISEVKAMDEDEYDYWVKNVASDEQLAELEKLINKK